MKDRQGLTPPSAIRYAGVPQRATRTVPEDDIDESPSRNTSRHQTVKRPIMQQGQVLEEGMSPAQVQVIFVRELLKTVFMFALFFVLSVAVTLVFQAWHFGVTSGDYDYNHYRNAIHATTPPCTLDGNLHGVTDKGILLLCDETGKAPSADQIKQWNGYLYWQGCYEYSDQLECKQVGS